ncbi:hypothetical protein V9T40_009296 [Parthenolecanium corni]|uniref:Uncharacterized protein n=1 Tax=Parthenolecanium corni TaxID=536013 RepID=A0AAN9TS89_9HEMI
MPTTLEQDTGLLGDFPYGSLFLTAFVIEGLGKTEDNRALEIASNMARSLIKTVYNGYEHDKNLLERYIVLPNSKMAKNYNEENKGKISAASLGCIISLLAQYGRVATSADYEAILTADIYSSQELVFASPRSTIDDWIDDTILDSESEEGVIPTETDDTEELENAETNAKRQKIE